MSKNLKKLFTVLLASLCLLGVLFPWPSGDGITQSHRSDDPQWHANMRTFIAKFDERITERQNPGYIAGWGETPLPRLIRYRNEFVREYTTAALRYAHGAQYRGAEKSLPQPMSESVVIDPFTIGPDFEQTVIEDEQGIQLVVIESHHDDDPSPYYLVDRWLVDKDFAARTPRFAWSPTRLDGGRKAREFVLKQVHVNELQKLGIDLTRTGLRPMTWAEDNRW